MAAINSAPPNGDQNKGPAMIAASAVTLAVAMIVGGARVYVRTRIIRKLWWDDFFAILGLLNSTVVFALVIVEVNSGIGRHEYYLHSAQISNANKHEIWTICMIITASMWTRLSVCLLLLRFAATKRWFRVTVYCVIVFVLAAGISNAISTPIRCRPISKAWMPSLAGKCWPLSTWIAVGEFNGVTSVVADFMLAILPIVYLWNVQISPRVKLGICCLMGVGFFTGVCAIVRTILLKRLEAEDLTYEIVDATIWGILENNIAIIAACGPTLKPLGKPLSSAFCPIWRRTPRSSGYINETDDGYRLRHLEPPQKSHLKPGDYHPVVEPRIELLGSGKLHFTAGEQASISSQDATHITKTTRVHVTRSDAGPRLGQTIYSADACVVADRV